MNDGSISTDLYQFLGTNFHQDWDLEADSWEGMVDNCVNEHPAAEPLRMLTQEIDDLLDARAEPDLKKLLVRVVRVDNRPAPLAYNEWLRQIANRFRQHANGISDLGAR